MAVACTCEQCGISFVTYPSRIAIGKGRYCSHGCANVNLKKEIQCICKQCKVLFTVTPSVIAQGGGNHCSKKCAAISIGLKKRGELHFNWQGGHSNYRGKNWTHQRKIAYQRDKGICQQCGKRAKSGKKQFHVHHIKPFAEFDGDYIAANELTNLITLCQNCHMKAEYGKIPVQPYLL